MLKKNRLLSHSHLSIMPKRIITDTNPVTSFSGNPGYAPGKPLISGVFDEETLSFSPANGDMMSWKASESSLCRDSGAEPVLFATDVDSSCSLQIAADNFTDCESLARSVRLIQGK